MGGGRTFGTSDMTRIDFKRKYEQVGLYSFAVDRKSRKGGRAFPSHANTEREQGVSEHREIKCRHGLED